MTATITSAPPTPLATEVVEAIDRLLARGVYDSEIARLLSSPHRALALVATRESFLYAMTLLDGMFSTTLAFNTDLPGVEEVLAQGLGPLKDDESPFARIRFRSGSLRGVLYEHKGVWYFTATGSAALSKEGSTNEYASVLSDILTVLRPHLLAAANISRLLRSPKVGVMIESAIIDRVDRVRLGSTELDLSNEMSAVVWHAFAAIASVERNLIVQRLAIGRINKWKRGEWFFGKMVQPPGYVLVDKRLVLDPSQKDLVAGILSVLADQSMPAGVASLELGKLGLKTRAGRGAKVNFGLSRDPSSSVEGLYRWVPLWATGIHDVTLKVPFPNLNHFAGVPVERLDADTNGFVRLRYEPGVPVGGWAEPEVLALATLARDNSRLVEPNTRPYRPQGRGAATRRGLFGGMLIRDVLSSHLLRFRHRNADTLELLVTHEDRANDV